ncbi:hypothetical protein JI739_02310 [Ramlibacter sp. AW1]|uniref:DUF4142 domain-containing protein n=1 Tax=Ramlibacter aurantiacus TaxID=2801330 RepID=A0A936ZL05_9BURK|nr:hypothetical protein [Ramlibacter aurantiacus]MBL0419170.1 hypothetical protein [Ramlibacter aurantiacus]
MNDKEYVMQKIVPIVTAAALSFAGATLAQTSGSGTTATAPASSAASSDQSQSMDKLQKAAQHLRESIQAMAQKRAGPDRDRAIDQAHEALLETHAAMLALPPDLRQGNIPEIDKTRPSETRRAAVSDADYERSVSQLMRAADSLRQSVQAMAQQPAGERRNQAMSQARQALWDTQQAMVSAYDPATARTMASQGRTVDTRASGAGAMAGERQAAQRVRADRN